MLECLERRELLAADLRVVKDIWPGTQGSLLTSSPAMDISEAFGDSVYFSANDGVNGYELWKTDGTEANTALFQDLTPGTGGTYPSNLLVANGSLYFTGRSGSTNRSNLYRLDGVTGQITTVKADIVLSSFNNVYAITSVGTTVYFILDLENGTNELWKSDGTEFGTVLVKSNLSPSANVYSFEGSLLFVSGENSSGVVWQSGGTEETTTPITGSPRVFKGERWVELNGAVYFEGTQDPGNLRQLWKLDSVSAAPIAVDRGGDQLTRVGSRLYFTTNNQLWRTNGTNAASVLVKEISPLELTAVNETVFFMASDATHGQELWRSNGTAEDTVLVKDIIPGTASGRPRYMFNMNGLLVFALDGSNTNSLWVSNGTEAGTTEFGGLQFNTLGQFGKIHSFTQLGNKLFFGATTAEHGHELFVFTLGDTPATPVITGPDRVVSTSNPTITWDAVGSATQYEIWIKNQSTGDDRLIVTPVTGTAFTPADDLELGQYTAWVRTLGTNGSTNSPWSTAHNFHVKLPVTLETVAPAPTTTRPEITWQALPGAVEYDVWVDRLDVPVSQFIRSTGVIGTSFTPSTDMPRGRYRVWVRGLDAIGLEGAWSSSADFQLDPVPVITGGLNPTFDTSPTITWNSIPEVASYDVYVLSINGNFRAFYQSGITGTSITLPTLPAGPYRYWVRRTGATIWSDPVEIDTSGRTDVLTPIGTTTNRRPLISWRPVDGAVRYELLVRIAGTSQDVINRTDLTSNSFTPTTDFAYGTYRIWVRAVSSTNVEAPYSKPVDFTAVVLNIVEPAAVTPLLRPTVSWNSVAGAVEYDVWIKNQSTGEDQVILARVPGTSFTPQIDLGIGHFTVWVQALGDNEVPITEWSPPHNFRINTPAAQNAVSVDSGTGLATISWQALPGAVKYDVWIDRLDVPTSEIYRNTNVSGTSITPTTLPNGKYRVWVRGLAADGAEGAWSLSQDFTKTQVPVITAGLNPTFDTSPTISWTAVPGASSYEVYVRSINGNFKALHQKNIAATTFTWPVLPAGPYEYWVRVTGATVWSVPVIINTDGRTTVLSPTGSTTNRRPVISWRPVDLAVRYELWVDQLGVDEKIIYRTNLTSTSFTNPSNLPLGNYRIWVRAVSSTTTAPWNPSVDFTIAEAGSTVEPGNDFALLTSIFSDAELAQLLEENSHPAEDARAIVNVSEVPQEVSANHFAILGFEAKDSVRTVAVNGISKGMHPSPTIRTRFRTSQELSKQVEESASALLGSTPIPTA